MKDDESLWDMDNRRKGMGNKVSRNPQILGLKRSDKSHPFINLLMMKSKSVLVTTPKYPGSPIMFNFFSIDIHPGTPIISPFYPIISLSLYV